MFHPRLNIAGDKWAIMKPKYICLFPLQGWHAGGLTDTGSRQLNRPHRAKAMLAAQFVTHKSRQIRTDCTVAAASDLQSEPPCSLAERRRSSRSQGPKVAMGTAPGLGVICSRCAAPIPLSPRGYTRKRGWIPFCQAHILLLYFLTL